MSMNISTEKKSAPPVQSVSVLSPGRNSLNTTLADALRGSFPQHEGKTNEDFERVAKRSLEKLGFSIPPEELHKTVQSILSQPVTPSNTTAGLDEGKWLNSLKQKLKARNFNINQKNHEGLTLLAQACRNGFVTAVTFLLGKGADFAISDHKGKTPLQYAIDVNSCEIVKSLLKAHALKKKPIAKEYVNYALKSNADQVIGVLLKDDTSWTAEERNALLVEACQVGKLANVKALLEVLPPFEESQLRECLQKIGNTREEDELYTFLLTKCAEFSDPNAYVIPQKETDLIRCIRKLSGQKDIKSLIDFLEKHKEYDINAGDEHGFTALHYAVCLPVFALDVVKILVEMGADMNARPPVDRATPLMVALEKKAFDVLSFLLQQPGIDLSLVNSFGNTLLHIACHDPENLEYIRRFFEKTIDIDVQNIEGGTPLHIAVASPYETSEIVRFLVEKGALLDKMDQHGATPLLAACQRRNEWAVTYLIGKKADIFTRNRQGFGVLQALFMDPDQSQKDVTALIKIFVEAGVGLNASGDDLSPLALAYHHKDVRGIEALLAYEDTDPNVSVMVPAVVFDAEKDTSQFVETPISFALCLPENQELKEVFRKNKKFNWDMLGKNRLTALTLAIGSGNTDIVRALLEVGACVNTIVDQKERRSLLMFALCQPSDMLRPEIIRMLLEKGAVLFPEGMEKGEGFPLFVAVSRKNLKVVQLLLEMGHDPNERTSIDTFPLLLAVQMGDYSMVKLLLENPKTRIDQETHNGATALMEACRLNHETIAKFLIEKGANPYQKELETQKTPLTYAQEAKASKLVQFIKKNSPFEEPPLKKRSDTPAVVKKEKTKPQAPKIPPTIPAVFSEGPSKDTTDTGVKLQSPVVVLPNVEKAEEKDRAEKPAAPQVNYRELNRGGTNAQKKSFLLFDDNNNPKPVFDGPKKPDKPLEAALPRLLPPAAVPSVPPQTISIKEEVTTEKKPENIGVPPKNPPVYRLKETTKSKLIPTQNTSSPVQKKWSEIVRKPEKHHAEGSHKAVPKIPPVTSVVPSEGLPKGTIDTSVSSQTPAAPQVNDKELNPGGTNAQKKSVLLSDDSDNRKPVLEGQKKPDKPLEAALPRLLPPAAVPSAPPQTIPIKKEVTTEKKPANIGVPSKDPPEEPRKAVPKVSAPRLVVSSASPQQKTTNTVMPPKSREAKKASVPRNVSQASEKQPFQPVQILKKDPPPASTDTRDAYEQALREKDKKQIKALILEGVPLPNGFIEKLFQDFPEALASVVNGALLREHKQQGPSYQTETILSQVVVFAALQEKPNILEKLLERIPITSQFIYQIARRGGERVLKVLCQKSSEINVKFTKYDSSGLAPIHIAVLQNDAKATEVMAHVKPECLYLRAESGDTPLMLVCKKDTSDALLALMKAGIDLSERGPDQETYCHIAAYYGAFQVVSNLCYRNPLFVTQRTTRGFTPLHYAVLLIDCATDQEAQIREKARELVVKTLIKSGAAIDQSTFEGITPLMFAARNGLSLISESLLKLGAHPNMLDNYGRTALHFAVTTGNIQQIQSLIAGGASRMTPDAWGKTPDSYAQTREVKKLFENLEKMTNDVRS